ncbi:peptide ABC transporter permease [Mesorhizobium sp. B2-3-3]|uniref:peptide ABC transporter permease n=1 Tax=unclassified Mesorhizobium TaxID=325217 RepID=UPI001126F8AC|nr:MULTISPECIES: peptide ABC transporter permease [unclassified Mesorhizobium]TPK76190.1 peptide ABC transporter permease [Mesorhizobium sp. B2-4-15]TPM29778.1 peptide ABC transporter permease [Mesorhizobium sp. B2-3-5]TPN40841.1 peptide ABC transporter permease [Mesorhizobium sp. B2-3-3]
MSKDRGREGPAFSGQDARQGEIILRTRTQRIIFVAGLIGIVVLALVLALAVR